MGMDKEKDSDSASNDIFPGMTIRINRQATILAHGAAKAPHKRI